MSQIDDICELTSSILADGWDRTVRRYKKELHNQTSRGNARANLRLLGDLRAFIFHRLYDRASRRRVVNVMDSGSKNITSDLDVQIYGKQAPQVVYDIFFNFLKAYKTTLDYTFDLNMYVAPLLGLKDSRPFSNKFIMGDVFILRANTNELCRRELVWALVKSIHLDLGSFPELQRLQQQSRKMDKQLVQRRDHVHAAMRKQYPKLPAKQLETVTSYKDNNEYARTLFRLIYRKGDRKNRRRTRKRSRASGANMHKIWFLYHAVQWSSVEAYYTVGAVIVVAIHLQAGSKIRPSISDYLCAALENAADLRGHCLGLSSCKRAAMLPTEKLDFLVKYSKNVYRTYYSLGGLPGNSRYRSLAKKIAKNVLPFRKKGRATIGDMGAMGFDDGSALAFAQALEQKVFEEVEKVLKSGIPLYRIP